MKLSPIQHNKRQVLVGISCGSTYHLVSNRDNFIGKDPDFPGLFIQSTKGFFIQFTRPHWDVIRNYGLRRKKEQSLSARCTEPARCPVASKLNVVTRFPDDLVQHTRIALSARRAKGTVFKPAGHPRAGLVTRDTQESTVHHARNAEDSRSRSRTTASG